MDPQKLVNLPDISAYNSEIEVSANVTRVLNYLGIVGLIPGDASTELIGDDVVVQVATATAPGGEEQKQTPITTARYKVDIRRGRVILEIKKPSVLREGKKSLYARQLHEINQAQINRRIVEQLATYLKTYGLTYGVITSYEWWWFAKLDSGSCTMYLSDPISWEQAGGINDYAPSVYQCLAALFSLTQQQHQ